MVLKKHCFNLIIDNIRNGDATNTTFFSLCLSFTAANNWYIKIFPKLVVRTATTSPAFAPVKPKQPGTALF